MTEDFFEACLLPYLPQLQERICMPSGEWTVKGFIDVDQRIYAMSLDTKILSKVIEMIAFPILERFAQEYGYDIILAPAQNYYPDLSFVSKNNKNECYALDIKTTYRTHPDKNGSMRVNGMTLGTFGGYFRTRNRPMSSTLAYDRYKKHYVLGVIYDRVKNKDDQQLYDLKDLSNIPSVARNFLVFLQEKYRIASDIPGSGNTKNIGSTHFLDKLMAGKGVFSKLGISIFDDYWMNYRTRAMAQAEGFEYPLYTNLREYQLIKMRGIEIIDVPSNEIESDADTSDD